VLDLLVETQVLLEIFFWHVREHVVGVAESIHVTWHRLGILLVDLGVSLVVALLPFLELRGGDDVLVVLGQEGIEGRVLISSLLSSLSASTAWSGLDDSGCNKSESK